MADEAELQPLVGRGRGAGSSSPGLARVRAAVPASSRLPGQGGKAGGSATQATLSVKGMHCASCSSAVEAALARQPGVVKAAVALLQEEAEVSFTPGATSPEQLAAAVTECGFEAQVLQERGRAASLQVATLRVSGMTCGSCSGAVERALQAVPGVRAASVALTTELAEVRFDGAEASEEDLVAAVTGAGFTAAVVACSAAAAVSSLTLRVTGMSCGACSSAVEAALRAVPGVERASVNVLTSLGAVQYDPEVAGPRHLLAAVQAAGFEAFVQQDTRALDQSERRAQLAEWGRLLRLSAALTLPVFLVAMVLPHFAALRPLLKRSVLGFPLDELVKWALTTPVQFGVAKRFHLGAYRALSNGRANMDVLVSLGTTAAYTYSLISILHHHFVGHHASGSYRPTDAFETSAMLICFVIMGKFLEAGAKGRTGDAITALLQLAPPTALLLEEAPPGPDGGRPEGLTQREVPSALIHRGDLLKVLPGARVPQDGVVESGTSHVDESMLTGESAPVTKRPGDTVLGGTLNLNGALQLRATRVGQDTALAQIVKLVQAAQSSKAPIQAFADTVAAAFVPAVVALAVLTFLVWYLLGVCGMYPAAWLPAGHTPFLFALLFGIAVLVVACPCALGLATPTAVLVGTGVAAAQGILIKGADALERVHRVRTVVFDKTGTLTQGRPTVTSMRTFDKQRPAEEVLALAAAVEAHSEHPLAAAVLAHAEGVLRPQPEGKAAPARRPGQAGEQRDLGWVRPAEDLEVVPGMGVRGWVVGGGGAGAPQSAPGRGPPVKVAVGNKALMAREGVPIPTPVDEWMRKAEGDCSTCVLVAAEGAVSGVLSISDPLKPEARGVVAALQQRGIAVHMVTGDNWRTARAVAGCLAINNVCAECLPGAKAAKIKELQGGRKVVAMVGDGINDSPALAAADCGIAVGSGTDIAIEAADYVLMRDDLEDVLVAIDLSQRTFGRIRLNFLWAMGYNVVMIPFAAGLFYPCTKLQVPPWLAGAAMAFSSVSVVCSSLQLRSYRRPPPVLRDVLVHR